jgi:hypothetical protein
MSRDGTDLAGSETDESPSEQGRVTPLTQYQIPMVSPSSVESAASIETVRPTNTTTTATAGNAPSHPLERVLTSIV